MLSEKEKIGQRIRDLENELSSAKSRNGGLPRNIKTGADISTSDQPNHDYKDQIFDQNLKKEMRAISDLQELTKKY